MDIATAERLENLVVHLYDLFEKSKIEREEDNKIFSEMRREADLRFLETDRQFKETDKQFKETDRQFKETDKQFKETDRKLKELRVQIGGLGNKFGLYNEGLFMPSLIKIMEHDFHCNYYTNNTKIKNNGSSFEIDFWGTSPEACYIVEVKSLLKTEAIKQLEKTIHSFKKAFPEYAKRKIYGAIASTQYSDEASTQYSDEIKKEVIKAGFYFISISDDVAKLKNPKGFKPKQW